MSIRPNAAPTHIHIVECALPFDVTFYKVGIASDVQRRVANLQVCCPLEIKLRHWRTVGVGAAELVEAAIHERLKPYRVRGEWFAAEYRTVLATVKNCVASARVMERNAEIAERERRGSARRTSLWFKSSPHYTRP